ncbi:DNA mismatch endonuclease vsr [Modestobacter italicus]|uniref:DNA mismatch endonuclease vsr n=1 Tax=Modestobacter italicus (strain DSM 44449 / CECT 9708 / BC 501) TaxID=2732864 RepID=I4F192_MODI5|nr:DNA mismatch endonuclease vsr [Modestobacter marinus]CCH89405.1 DNA mismatch endonuclease vsr [Modestobacter marinus]
MSGEAAVDLRLAPAPSSATVRARFRRQGRRDTVPELAVRRRLHARGVRYRVDVRPCRETRARGDIVWKRRKLVVFIDGRRTPLPPTARRLAAGPCRGAEGSQAGRQRRA